MAQRIYPLNGISYWYAYDIEEVCALYKSRKLHQKTVRQWIKQGLPTIAGRPVLIYGHDLRVFLGKLNSTNKCATQFNEMYCFKCRDAKPVFKRQISVDSQQHKINTKGHCRDCKTVMNKTYKLADWPELKRIFCVVDVLELYDSAPPPVNTPFVHRDKATSKDQLQRELQL